MLEEKKSTIGKKMSNFVIIRLLEKIWQDCVQPRAFILNDSQGNPEYFGGIIVPVEE